MNTLSIFLYLADVLQNVQVIFGTIGGFGSIGSAFLLLMSIIDSEEAPLPLWKSFVMFLTFVILTIFAALIPSKETLYLIAGSEIGEMAITSDPAKQLFSDINEVIQHQLNELKGGE